MREDLPEKAIRARDRKDPTREDLPERVRATGIRAEHALRQVQDSPQEEATAAREAIPDQETDRSPAVALIPAALRIVVRMMMISPYLIEGRAIKRAQGELAVSVRILTSRFWIKRLPRRMTTVIRETGTELIRKRTIRKRVWLTARMKPLKTSQKSHPKKVSLSSPSLYRW